MAYRYLSIINATALFFALALTQSHAQQVPVFNTFAWHPKLLNPAAQGGGSVGGATLLYRSQFSMLPADSRPVSYLAHVDASPLLGGGRVGLGLLALHDEAHLTQRTNVTGFFAYHLFPQDQMLRLSLGAMAGVINQGMQLGKATVNDPFDLVLMQGTLSKTQFDGGLGAQLQYGPIDGSRLSLDVSLPQLFSSELRYQPGGNAETRAARYDLLPHLFASLRYRWQGEGFALEPNVVYRETFGPRLKAANFDFHARAYFLERDRFMIGGGYRMNQGGFSASVGVKPIPSINLTASYENHAVLGNTIEVGMQYLMDKCKPGVAENELEKQILGANMAREAATLAASPLRDALAFARSALKDAQAATDYATQQAKLANADKYLGQAKERMGKIKTEAQKTSDACAKKDELLRNAAAQKRPLCNAKDAERLPPICAATRKLEEDLVAELAKVQTQRDGIPILINTGDPTVLRQLFETALKNLPDRPEDLSIVRFTAQEMEFQFADPAKVYGAVSIRHFADALSTQFETLKKQGVTVESVRLIGELQSSKPANKTTANYAGEYGDAVKESYKMNKTPKLSDIKKGAALTLENLAVLKLLDLKRYWAPKLGLAEQKIGLEVNAPTPGIEYDFVARIVVVYKK